MRFSCPECHQPLKIRDDLAGKKGKCPACKAPVVVPNPTKPENKPAPAIAPEPPPLASPKFAFDLVQEGRQKVNWRLAAFKDRLSFQARQTGDHFKIYRKEAADRIRTARFFLIPPLLMVKRDKKKLTFKLSPEALAELNRWVGHSVLLKMALNQRFSWCLPIGILYLLGSIPIPGNPQTGLDPVPFDPFSAGLGAILILLSILMKKKPHPALFLADSAWFGLLIIYTTYQIANGASIYWLLVVVVQLILVISGVNHYRNFANLTDIHKKPRQGRM